MWKVSPLFHSLPFRCIKYWLMSIGAVAPFVADPEVNSFFFMCVCGKRNIICGGSVLVYGLGFARASIKHFQLGASWLVTQLHCQGGFESDQGTDPVRRLCIAHSVCCKPAPFPFCASLPSGRGMALSLSCPFHQGHVFLLPSLQWHWCFPHCKFRVPKWLENINVGVLASCVLWTRVLKEGWWLIGGGNA